MMSIGASVISSGVIVMMATIGDGAKMIIMIVSHCCVAYCITNNTNQVS